MAGPTWEVHTWLQPYHRFSTACRYLPLRTRCVRQLAGLKRACNLQVPSKGSRLSWVGKQHHAKALLLKIALLRLIASSYNFATSPRNTRSPLPPLKAAEQSIIVALHSSLANSTFVFASVSPKSQHSGAGAHLSQHHHNSNISIVDISSNPKHDITKQNRPTSPNDHIQG